MSSTNPGPATTTQTPLVASIGNVSQEYVLSVALSPAIVAANTSAEQTFTVTGLALSDAVSVNKPTAQAGIGIVGTRVSAANTLAITFGNFTAVGITPTAAEAYLVKVSRPIAQEISNGLPSALPLS